MAKEWTNGFYTSKEWRKTRDAYYRIQCGRCERCMAEVLAGARRVEDINPGIIVHHKKELTPENINDPAVALSFDNLELLCDEHHNRQHKAKAKRYTFDAKGNLIESKSKIFFHSTNLTPPGISFSGLPKRTEGVRSKKLCKSRAHRRGVKYARKYDDNEKQTTKKN